MQASSATANCVTQAAASGNRNTPQYASALGVCQATAICGGQANANAFSSAQDSTDVAAGLALNIGHCLGKCTASPTGTCCQGDQPDVCGECGGSGAAANARCWVKQVRPIFIQ